MTSGLSFSRSQKYGSTRRSPNFVRTFGLRAATGGTAAAASRRDGFMGRRELYAPRDDGIVYAAARRAASTGAMQARYFNRALARFRHQGESMKLKHLATLIAAVALPVAAQGTAGTSSTAPS